MDLGDIDLEAAAAKGVRVTLVHPGTGEQLTAEDGTDIVFNVLGRDSSEWQKVSNKIGKKIAAKYKKKVPPEAVEDSLREVLSHCTVSWENVVFDGEELECTQENAYKLYEARQWIAEQILEKAVDRAAYFLA
tara:strand:+ start:38065 stop:38463 length:399 start_codon:yes stop_codon:yes gene_type:complete